MAAIARSAASRTVRVLRADDQEIAAADAAGHADLILAEELAIHHRNAPVASLAHLLGDLEAVAEIAQLRRRASAAPPPRGRRSRPSPRWSARIGRRGQRSCFCSSLELMAKIRTVMPGRPSGVSLGARRFSIPASQPQAMTEVAKPVRLRAAVSAHSGGIGGDDQARRPHAEGLGEGVLDGDAVDDHASAGPRRGMDGEPAAAQRPRSRCRRSRKLPHSHRHESLEMIGEPRLDGGIVFRRADMGGAPDDLRSACPSRTTTRPSLKT